LSQQLIEQLKVKRQETKENDKKHQKSEKKIIEGEYTLLKNKYIILILIN